MPTFVGEESRKFDAVPEGDYVLTITNIDERTAGEKAKHAGAAMWRITYDIGDTGRKVFNSLTFVQESAWRLSNWWRALGRKVIPKEVIDPGNPQDLIGAELQAHLVVTEYNGDPQNDIAYFIEPKPGQVVAKDPPDIPF
jgi:hypothetical protein